MPADSDGQASRVLTALAAVVGVVAAIVSTVLALAEAPAWRLWLLPAALAVTGLLLVAYLAWTRFHGRDTVLALLAVGVVMALILVAVFSTGRMATQRRAAAAAQGCQEAREHLDRGRAHLDEGRGERAVDEFRAAVTLCTEDGLVADASLSRGMAHFERGDEREAIRYLTVSLDRRENHQAFLTRGKAYGRELAHCDAAAFDFRRSLRAKQDFHPAYHNLAIIRARQGSYRRALDAITRALELNENEPDYLLTRAMVRVAGKQTTEALSDLRASVERSGSRNDGYNHSVNERATRLLRQVEAGSAPTPAELFAPCRPDLR